MDMNGVKIMFNWLDNIEKDFEPDEVNIIIGNLVRHARDGKEYLSEEKRYLNPTIREYSRQIDIMANNYQKQAEFGKNIGRKSTFNEEENNKIYELAKNGYKATEIAAEMGITDKKKIKAIYNSEGWKNRNS
jgi:hypothetical protein